MSTPSDPTVVGLALLLSDEVALIDRADWDLCLGFKWRLMKTGYVCAQRGEMYLYLHRLIAGAGPEEVIDHVNGKPLDNRLMNLRVVTRSQNSANRRSDTRKRGKTSEYKGVFFDKHKNVWIANIHVSGKTSYVGRSSDEHEAARMYNRAAVKAWGEYARLNIVPEDEGIPALLGDQ